jgi:hypothetical protein
MTCRNGLSLLAAASVLMLSIDAAADCPASAGSCQELIANGSTGSELDLVFVGDGYTADQEALFFQHAQQISTALAAVTPYAERVGQINMWALFSPSNQSGASHPELGTTVDNVYGASYNCMSVARIICADGSKVLADVNPRLPQHDTIAVIVNDTTYGGSGGSFLTISVDPSAVEILRHELGHTLGALADEYTKEYPGYPAGDPEPNVSLSENLSSLKWSAWVTPGTPIPTPESLGVAVNDPIGAFEGARYQTTGIYRPSIDCRMRHLGVDFCSVCSEALSLGIARYARLFDVTSPADPIGCVPTGGTSTFSVTGSVSTLSATWDLDGSPVGGSSLSIDLTAAQVPAGKHTLTINVVDQTPLVKNDPDQVLRDSFAWSVEVAPDCAALAGSAGTSGGSDVTRNGTNSTSTCAFSASSESSSSPFALMLLFSGLALTRRRK